MRTYIVERDDITIEIEADKFYLQHGVAVFYYDGSIIASVPADKYVIYRKDKE